jgi:hypothetical protein
MPPQAGSSAGFPPSAGSLCPLLLVVTAVVLLLWCQPTTATSSASLAPRVPVLVTAHHHVAIPFPDSGRLLPRGKPRTTAVGGHVSPKHTAAAAQHETPSWTSFSLICGLGMLSAVARVASRRKCERPTWALMAAGGEDKTGPRRQEQKLDTSSKPPPVDPVSRLVWQATEWFGTATGALRQPTPPTASPAAGRGLPATVDEAVERLREDYAREYFLTGDMDLDLYSEDCYFADDFAGFNGRARFKANLDNLTAFIVDRSVRLLALDVEADASGRPIAVRSRCLVKLQLNLPWRPVLAWVWGVRHVLSDDAPIIVRHLETWEVTPQEGIRQLFRPGPPDGLRQGQRDP